MNERIEIEFAGLLSVLRQMADDAVLQSSVIDAVTISVDALRSGNKLLFAGNGGSAADAQHWAGELVSRFRLDRVGLHAFALTTDTSILTAIGNDYGYDYVFARQVEAMGKAGDVLFAISTSGNSKNVLRAVEAAKARDMRVIGFTGRSGGALGSRCDICFKVPSYETPRIQEGHEFLGHLICGMIEQEMFGQML